MKSVKILKKWIIGVTLASSFIVLAHSVLDNAKFYDLNFINEDEVVFDSNINEQRIIASNEVKINAPRISKVSEIEASNIEKNQWEIVRITNTLGSVFYDKNIGGDQDSKIMVNLEIINPYKIRLNKDGSLDYFISHYKRSTIALFHKVNDSYEILELKRIKEIKVATTNSKLKNAEQSESKKAKGMIFNNEGELIAYSAVDPSRNRRAVLASQIGGSIEVVDGEINVSDLVLHQGTEFETEPVSFGARVLDGGVIRFTDNSTGSMANAILMNNGENGFTLRFTSGGPLSGALVNFFTPEEIDKKNRVSELQRQRLKESSQEFKNPDTITENNQRKIASNNNSNNELDEDLNNDQSNPDEDIDENIEEESTGGFQF